MPTRRTAWSPGSASRLRPGCRCASISARSPAGRLAAWGAAVPDRQAVLRAELAGVAAEGGCALVIRTTVDEAQQAFCQLRDWFGELQAAGADSSRPGFVARPVPDAAARRDHRPGDGALRQEGPSGRYPAPRRGAGGHRHRGTVARPGLRRGDQRPGPGGAAAAAGRALPWRHEDLGVITRPRWAAGPRLVVLVPPGRPRQSAAVPVLDGRLRRGAARPDLPAARCPGRHPHPRRRAGTCRRRLLPPR